MTWYLAKIVFRIICGDGNHTPQFDEQLRLICAEDAFEAFTKAQHLGTQEEDRFVNAKHQLVSWQFINVAELYTLNGFIDGAELYSRIYETDNPEQYISLVNGKAEHLEQMETHKLLQLL